MEHEGPALESLLRRLSETPEDFLAEPRIGKRGSVSVPAVVGDLCHALALPMPGEVLERFAGKSDRADRNRLALTLITCWLLSDAWFQAARFTSQSLLELLEGGLGELAEQTGFAKFISDADRREELARFALARLGYRPQGETPEQAQDRLTSLSCAERKRVMQAARRAEERARAIREQLARKAAQESADKWTRE